MTVIACGALVWRRTFAGDLELLVAHRPRYDDWSFAKGKLDPGETIEDCARREVVEETGLTVVLGERLPDVTYRDRKNRDKVVHYWAATVLGGAFVANDEVDEIRWVDAATARSLLSYERDVSLIAKLEETLR